ncbi:MAG: PilX N-terminal domain-containing pilus assembly protein [Gemmatimonadota bacterium]
MDTRMDSAPAGPTRSDERGAALMMVLVVLVGLTVLGAAGLVVTTDDVRQSENVEASTEAFYAADAGLQRYLGESNDGSTAVTYTIGNSSVTVTPIPLTTLVGGEGMYRVRSVATHTDPAGAATSRAVSALSVFRTGSSLSTKAAFASGTGLLKNGGSGEISGTDLASPSDPLCSASPGNDVAGVTVPPDGYTQNGGSPVPEGDPPIDDSQTAEELLEATNIDWEDLHDNGGDIAEYSVPPDDWPDFDEMESDEWPVIYVDDDIELSPEDSGRGTIIVTGNVAMSGSFQWDGILLVGGYLTSNGYQTITGATVSGLNMLLGESVPTSDIGNGNKKFLYNSCYVESASKGFMGGGGMALVPGSWAEEI